jgi:signal transduction histidine kinase/ligand-binding sensor domain-containing protein
MRSLAIVCGCLLVFFSLLNSVYGQKQYIFKNWDNSNGLPQNTVYDVVKDHDGFLWVATDEGLLKFDGNVFKVFDEDNTPQLLSSAFYDIEIVKNGIWAANRISVLLLQNNTVKNFDFSALVKGSWITAIAADKKGRVFVGTNSGNLYCIYNNSINKYLPWTYENQQSIQVMKTTEEGILLGTDAGLFTISAKDDHIREIAAFSTYSVRSIVVARDKSAWIGTKENGLFHLSGSQVSHFTKKDGLQEMFVSSLAETAEGDLWVGTGSSGVQKLSYGHFSRIKELTFSNDAVKTILVDADRVWMGTTARGLILVKPAEITMLAENKFLSGQIILPVYQHENGEVWIGTAGSGLNRIRNGHTTNFTMADGLLSNVVLSICGNDEFIFIGTPAGLNLFDLKKNRITGHYTTKDGLTNNIVQAVFIDSKKRTWLTTRSGGIHTLTKEGKLTAFPLPDHFSSAEIIAVFEDSHGMIWFGSSGTGIVSISSSGELKTNYSIGHGQSADMVYTFYEDPEGTIWMGTQAGLIYYEEGKFHLLNKSNGLKFNGIFQMIDDGIGYLWMSGNFGLQQVAISELIEAKQAKPGDVQLLCRLFDQSDGMANSETNGGIFPAGGKLANGQLWFPTVKGIAIVHPASINTGTAPLKVYINSIRYGNREFPPSQNIVVPPGVFNIEIDYGSIDFLKPQTISYFTRLKGVDSAWQHSGNRRTAYFTSLDPGHYIFEVRAEQFGNTSGISHVEFEVKPFFYQTILFKAVGFVLLIIVGIFLKQFYSKKQEENKLKKLVDERTRELMNSNKRFEQQEQELTKAVIQAQEQERFQIGAELHDNVNQILATAQLTVGLVKSAVEVEHHEWLDKSNSYIGMAIDEIRTLSHRLAPTSFEEKFLETEVQSLVDSINEDGRYTIEVCFDDPHKIQEVCNDIQLTLYRILQEQLKNILKYAAASCIQISVRIINGNVMMSVLDDGKGFDIHSMIKGIGINNMRKRTEMFNGKFHLHSSVGQGCSLIVEIPLQAA